MKPYVAIVLTYQDENNQQFVLLLKPKHSPNLSFPGGRVYKNENEQQALINSLRECTGIDVHDFS